MTRTTLLTGASSGIGLAAAVELSRRGEHVVLWSRSPGPLEAAAQRCRDAGAASASATSVDVGDDAAVATAFAQVVAASAADGRMLDAVVHAAGVAAYGRFEAIPPAVFDGVIATNLLGSANVARAAIPHLRDQGRGTLVLVGSVIGTIAAPMMSPYAVSKWGMRSLARHLQLEQRDRPGVHVCLVTPGGVATPIYRRAANHLGHRGKPPPPVASAERVGRVIARTLDRPRHRVSIGAANPVMALGFTLLPALFDRLVEPLFDRLAVEPGPTATTVGNVLDPST